MVKLYHKQNDQHHQPYITLVSLSNCVRHHCPRPIGLMLTNAEAGSHVIHAEGIHFFSLSL